MTGKSIATVETPGLIRKSFEFSTKAVNEPKGIVSAAVNAIGVVDLQKDQIEPGAWNSVINKFHTREQGWPSVLVGHEWSAGVGTVVNAWEGSDQLYVDAKFNLETQAGRDAFSNARAGVYKSWSVGFLPGDWQYDEHGVRHVKSIDAWPEVSLVLVGASPNTRTLSTKGASAQQVVRRIIEDAAARTGINPHVLAEAVLERLGAPARQETPVLQPVAQPFDWELNDPERARQWVWDETERRYHRRAPDRIWEAPAYKPASEPETLDEATARWARGGYGQRQKPK